VVFFSSLSGSSASVLYLPHSLSSSWGERPDYENVKKEHRKYVKVEPINFNQEQKEMLGHCKMLLERGYIAINPAFDKLIIPLRTAVAGENIRAFQH
jgi:hypothetical protein